VWTYKPYHRRFAFKQVNGSINSVDVRCNLDSLSTAFDPGRQWTLPDDAGVCRIDVKGSEGTTFMLVEYPG